MDFSPNYNSKRKFDDQVLRTLLLSSLKKTPPETSKPSPDYSTEIFQIFPSDPEPVIKLSEILENHKLFQSKNLNIRSLIRKSLKCNENLQLSQPDRNKLWLLLSDFSNKSLDNSDYFSKLLNFSQKKYPDHFLKMVELDVFRTIISPKCSESMKEEIIKKLRNILNVYACRNPYIGYCQGFNFIVAEFIMSGLEENEAFWLFTYVLEILLPLDYYTSMIGIMVDQKVFLELLRIEFPEIIEKWVLGKL